MVYNVETKDEKHPELDDEYMLFLDPNGYVLGFKVTAETVDQYLFVKDSDEELGDWVAKVVLPDATTPKAELEENVKGTLPTAEIEVPYYKANSKPAKIDFADTTKAISWVEADGDATTLDKVRTNIDGLIWKYTVDKNGVYELTYVPVFDSINYNLSTTPDDQATDDTQWYINGAEIENGEAFVTYNAGTAVAPNYKNGFIVDKNTVFVDTVNDKVYTGYNEVPNVENAEIAYVLDGKVAKVVFILNGDIYDQGSVYFVIADNTKHNSFNYDKKTFWTYDKAYVNGVKTPLNIRYNAWDDVEKILDEGKLYKVKKTIDEDYIIEVDDVTTPVAANVWAVGDDAFWLVGTGNNPEKFTCDKDTVFVVVEKDDKGEVEKIYDGDLKDMLTAKDLADEDCEFVTSQVQVLEDDDGKAELVYIWNGVELKPEEEKHTVGGTGEGAKITALDSSALIGTVTATVHSDSKTTAEKLAIAALEEAGYIYNYTFVGKDANSNDVTYLVATYGDRQTKFELVEEIAYKVTLTMTDKLAKETGTKDAVRKLSEDVLYIVNGKTETVTVSGPATDKWTAGLVTTSSQGVQVSNAVAGSDTTKTVVSVTLTNTGDTAVVIAVKILHLYPVRLVPLVQFVIARFAHRNSSFVMNDLQIARTYGNVAFAFASAQRKYCQRPHLPV